MNDFTKLVTFLKNWWAAIQKHTYSVSVDNFPEYPEFPEIPETIIPEYPTEIKVSNLEEIKPIDRFADIVKAIEKQSKDLKTDDKNIVGELKAILEEVRKEEEDLTPEVIKKISELIKSVDSKSIDFSVLENELKLITEAINSIKEYDEVKVKLNSKQFEKLSKTTATAITSGTSGGAKEDTLQQIEDIVTDTYCGSDKKAIGVRGRTNDGVCERLATEVTLGESKTFLSLMHILLQSIYGRFMEKVLNRNNSNNAGIISLGSGYDEGNDYIATKKLQTQNIQQIDVTTGTYTYNINQVSDPGKYASAEINQIVISGFNFSQDARLKIKYYAFRYSDSNYYMIWQNSIGYGNSQGLQYESKITFNPIPVGDWNRDDGRYGYIEVGVDGGTENHDFNVLVSVNPFVNYNI